MHIGEVFQDKIDGYLWFAIALVDEAIIETGTGPRKAVGVVLEREDNGMRWYRPFSSYIEEL